MQKSSRFLRTYTMSVYNEPSGALLGKDGNVERKRKLLLAIELGHEAIQLNAEVIALIQQALAEINPPKPAPVLTLIVCRPEGVEGD
jgi:hypothetical protein